MIKLMLPNNFCNFVDSPPQTKCAEIYIQNDSNFSIFCVFCKTKIIGYQKFKKHFEKLHLDEIVNFNQRSHNDDDDSKSNNQTKKDLISSDPLGIVANISSEQPIKANQTSNECVENSDPPENSRATAVVLNECEESLSHPPTNDDDDDVDDDDDDDSEDRTAEEVDWSKPYQPNLLKAMPKRPYKPRNKQNACHYCGKTFRRRYQLDTHINIHTGLKPHQCEICGRQFRAGTTLARHQNTHTNRQIHSCQFCDKTFTHKAALLSHESRHKQERTVECDECGKSFYTVNQLDTHKGKIHNKRDESTLPFVCDLCQNRYRTASMLSTHKFRKHYKSAKYSCEQCDKKFVTEDDLKIHVNDIHYGRMPRNDKPNVDQK